MKEHEGGQEQPSSFAEQWYRVGPWCVGRSGSRRIIWTPHRQHRDLPFALSSCPYCSSSSKSWPLPYRPAKPQALGQAATSAARSWQAFLRADSAVVSLPCCRFSSLEHPCQLLLGPVLTRQDYQLMGSLHLCGTSSILILQ